MTMRPTITEKRIIAELSMTLQQDKKINHFRNSQQITCTNELFSTRKARKRRLHGIPQLPSFREFRVKNESGKPPATHFDTFLILLNAFLINESNAGIFDDTAWIFLYFFHYKAHKNHEDCWKF